MMEITRAAGDIGIPGLYVTADPGAVDDAAKAGSLSLAFGKGWSKSHTLHTGQTPVLKYNRMLMQAILYDRVTSPRSSTRRSSAWRTRPGAMRPSTPERRANT